MTTIHIPPAALEAGLREYYVVLGMGGTLSDALRAAFVAMVEAWPGMRNDWTSAFADEVALILPLTQTQGAAAPLEDGDD